MNKVVDKPVQIGEKRTRYSFRLYYDDSSIEAGNKDQSLVKLFQEFTDQPALLRCGPVLPEKLAIYHDGARWIVAAEAEADNV